MYKYLRLYTTILVTNATLFCSWPFVHILKDGTCLTRYKFNGGHPVVRHNTIMYKYLRLYTTILVTNATFVALVTRIVVYRRKYLYMIVLCRTTGWPPLKKL